MKMLLRSSSTPILNSRLPHCLKGSSQEPESQVSYGTSSISLSNSIDDHTRKRIVQSLTELNNIQKDQTPKPKMNKKPIILPHPVPSPSPSSLSSSLSLVGILFSISGLGEKVVKGDEGCDLQTLVAGGGMGGDGGKICKGGRDGGGGANGGGGAGGSGFSDSTDACYQKMIEADPGNALLLGNYAKFLKQVTGNFAKAEEYCERAILADPNDGNIQTVYADLIWQNQKDKQRAETYFEQAVKTNPDDCYVLASYARFLWDSGEGDQDE